jgi:rhodanese-related sulfurtransferase
MMVLAALFLVVGLSACGDKGYTDIGNEELKTMLEEHPEYQYVDVRTSQEYYQSHVPGFTYLIDFYLLEKDYSLLDGLDKDVPVVIMCNSGNRSAEAAEIFVEQGFTMVYNLENGIQDWDGETE